MKVVVGNARPRRSILHDQAVQLLRGGRELRCFAGLQIKGVAQRSWCQRKTGDCQSSKRRCMLQRSTAGVQLFTEAQLSSSATSATCRLSGSCDPVALPASCPA